VIYRRRALALALVLVAALAGCSKAAENTLPPVTPTTPELIDVGPLVFPDYANPFTPQGKPFGTAQAAGFVVSYFEVTRSVAATDSGLIDTVTHNDVWPAGRPTLYVETVVTRVDPGDVYIDVTLLEPVVSVASAGMNYAGGIQNIPPFDVALANQVGVSQLPVHLLPTELIANPRRLLAQGQSIAKANVMPLLTGKTYGFDVEYFRASETAGKDDPYQYVPFPSVRAVFS